MTITAQRPPETATVQVFFGEHVIASHTGPADEAEHYAELLNKRFAGLRVITVPGDANETTASGRPIPPRALWGRTPN